MKTHFLTGVLALILFSALPAQNRQWALQVNNSLITEPFANPNSPNLTLAGFSPSVQVWSEKGLRHWVEWSSFAYANDQNTTGNFSEFETAFRYEIDYPLWGADQASSFYFGASVQLFYRFFQFSPTVTDLFSADFFQAGTRYALIPVFKQDLNQKFYVEFALPVHIGSFSWDKNRTENPSLPPRQQETTTINIDLNPARQVAIRFGIGLRI